MTNSIGSRTWRSGASGLISNSPTFRPRSRMGWRTVVRPAASAPGMSSKPTTDTSRGTRRQLSRRLQHANRQHIAQRDDGCRVGLGQQPATGGTAGRGRVVPCRDYVNRSGKRLPQPPDSGRIVHEHDFVVRELGHPPAGRVVSTTTATLVSERSQMAAEQSSAADVVDRNPAGVGV